MEEPRRSEADWPHLALSSKDLFIMYLRRGLTENRFEHYVTFSASNVVPTRLDKLKVSLKKYARLGIMLSLKIESDNSAVILMFTIYKLEHERKIIDFIQSIEVGYDWTLLRRADLIYSLSKPVTKIKFF